MGDTQNRILKSCSLHHNESRGTISGYTLQLNILYITYGYGALPKK